MTEALAATAANFSAEAGKEYRIVVSSFGGVSTGHYEIAVSQIVIYFPIPDDPAPRPFVFEHLEFPWMPIAYAIPVELSNEAYTSNEEIEVEGIEFWFGTTTHQNDVMEPAILDDIFADVI